MNFGYFGTMGMPSVDYIVADPVSIAATSEAFYTEKARDCRRRR